MNSKRSFSLLLTVFLAVSFPLTALADTDNYSYEEYRAGAGLNGKAPERTEEYTVIEIETEADLVQLAKNCSLDVWSVDKLVSLNTDIVLQENTDVSIPSFGGIFEGNGYRITNLQLTAEGSGMGLFRYIQEGGRVQNLTVEGKVAPGGSKSQTGGIAGINYGSIIRCSFLGSVSGDAEIGGIAGVNGENGEIRQCEASAVVTGNHSVGGICGSNHGILNNCKNTGDINTYGTEVAYSPEELKLEEGESLRSTSRIAAHTDSGGITGISDGKIYYCTNTGTVGYAHVGYNTGGIAGRLHQGYIQNCTNTGHILGRKDVGGIVGQMEPFLEMQYLNDKLKELDRQADSFLNLLDVALQDADSCGEQAAQAADSLMENFRGMILASKNLTGTVKEVWYLYNQELTGMSDDLTTLKEDLIGAEGGNTAGDTGNDTENVEGDKESDTDNDISVSGGDSQWPSLPELPELPDGGWRPEEGKLESYAAALGKFGDSTSEHLKKIAAAGTDRLEGIQSHLESFHLSLEAALEDLDGLGSILEAGGNSADANLDALIEQGRSLRQLISEIRDDLFRYEGLSIEDVSDEKAGGKDLEVGADLGEEKQTNGTSEADTEEEVFYDTTSFQQGKVTRCMNKGNVEADTNVGGIVGQVSTEYDFDPEDDITLTGEESFRIEQTVKAVVRESRNLGTVVSKKDYAGGVVGKADFGAIISCESYGNVSSTGGGFVGGIAGASGYAVRSCCSMGELSGKKNIGGIAGKGCDIFYSYAYNTLGQEGECRGAIAGSLEETGRLYGNYYVDGDIGGVDGISYEEGARPLSYEDFRKLEGLPEAFVNFTVSFVAEGKELAAFQCSYGDSLPQEQIPKVPEKEGCYGFWPEFNFNNITGSQVLEAQYERWTSSLEGDILDENGRPRVLAEGEFFAGAKLEVKEENGVFSLAVKNEGKALEAAGGTQEYQGPVKIRVLCRDPEKAAAEVLTENGSIQPKAEVMGSYLLFEMECPGNFRIIEKEDSGRMLWYAVSAGVLLIGLVLFLFLRRKRKQGKAGTEKEKLKKAENQKKGRSKEKEENKKKKGNEKEKTHKKQQNQGREESHGK